MEKAFLPISKKDMKERGWDQCDFVFVIGDAYVDHPSFGHAIISRLLEAHGFRVGIISQPDWKDEKSISILGKPRLGFLVSAGNMDSMVNHYTVSRKRRQKDAYTPGGVMGKRPDYATIVYCNLIRQTYKHKPIIIGGIEASLRRLAHYDYWSNKLKRSILLDSGADLISYGMGEHSIVEIADALDSGLDIKDITFIDGTVYKTRDRESIYDAIELPHFEALKADKLEYAKSFYIQYSNTDPFSGKRLFETYDEKLFVVQNPPAKPLTQSEMDSVYALPYMRDYHPSYKELGGVPAIEEVKFSLISNRGCFGGCSFCALTFHQGRIIQTRSHESLIREAKLMTQEKDFKGYRRFYIKYAKYIQDPVILGSLTHLMTDYYYNNITYTKKAIWDEQRKNIIGVKLNNGKQIKCNKEELRKLKRNDFRIYADYVYKNSKFEDLKFDEKILSIFFNTLFAIPKCTPQDGIIIPPRILSFLRFLFLILLLFLLV